MLNDKQKEVRHVEEPRKIDVYEAGDGTRHDNYADAYAVNCLRQLAVICDNKIEAYDFTSLHEAYTDELAKLVLEVVRSDLDLVQIIVGTGYKPRKPTYK